MKLVVNKLNYEVTMTDKVNDTDDLGIFNCETQTIKIKSSLSNEQKIRTFLHELAHLYMWCYGFSGAEFNEETICNFIGAYFEPMQKDLKQFINEFIADEPKRREEITLKEFFNSKMTLAIHCVSKEEASILMEAFDKIGEKWCDGKRYISNSYWEDYKRNTCYTNDNLHDDIEFLRDFANAIYEFEDVIFEED